MTVEGVPPADLNVEECWARLRSASMGRIAINLNALPVILPVFYVVDNEAILFRTSGDGDCHAARVDQMR
jgi:nitroimidazol reductase NimA-like FMN-containing flavoprotein (pyridoxamine 5'-phosphate oxidase superfamily)